MSKARSERHYLRDEQSKADRGQSKFGVDGNLTAEASIDLRGERINIEAMVTCIYCLGDAKLQRFLKSKKRGGLSTSKVECPFCGNGMFMTTVTRRWTARSYAEHVFNSRRFGFFETMKKAVGFEKWRERIIAHGWVDFWDEYRRLKTENPTGASVLKRLGWDEE